MSVAFGGEDRAFRSAASGAAFLAAAAGFVYSVAFVVLRNSGLAAIMLTAGGLLSVVALVGVHRLVRPASPGLGTVGLLFAAVGATGAAIHGAYDLANVINPPATASDLPNAVDPRGFLTFGLSGIGIGVLSILALRADGVDRRWAWLGVALAALLVVVYVGRLVVLDAASPLILVPAGLTGFVINPAWYVWAARTLARG